MSSKLYTFEQWKKNPCKLEVGTRLDEELINYFFSNSMEQPSDVGRKCINIYVPGVAFQHSEPYRDAYVRKHVIKGDILYRTYAKIHGNWYYMGLCFEGEMIDRSDLDK